MGTYQLHNKPRGCGLPGVRSILLKPGAKHQQKVLCRRDCLFSPGQLKEAVCISYWLEPFLYWGSLLQWGILKPHRPPAQPPALQHAPAQPAVYLATWNLEWLVRLADYPQLLANCDPNGQPNSNEWRFPCDNEHAPPPAHSGGCGAVSPYCPGLSGAVVALQEVDGPEAAAQLFPPSAWQLACFSQRKHPQNLGFALPRGIDYECGRELLGLDIDGKTRPGW